MQPTIAVDTDFATQINIATVEPENQPKLVQLLREATDSLFSKMPGWISTSILKGKDGRRVFIYSQWRSTADIEAFSGRIPISLGICKTSPSRSPSSRPSPAT